MRNQPYPGDRSDTAFPIHLRGIRRRDLGAHLGERAGWDRPEPDVAGVTRSTPNRVCAGQEPVRGGLWGWPGAGSNRRPSDFQSDHSE
jgi:hypothetical protein